MPIRNSLPVRIEDFQSGPVGQHRYYYLFCPVTGKWLSTHAETYSCGRNTSPGLGFMRMQNAVQMTATRGYQVLHQATLVWYGATTSNATTDYKFNIYNNGSVVSSVVMSGTAISGTLDVDIDVGSLSVEMGFVSPGIPAGGNQPEFQIAWRWRL